MTRQIFISADVEADGPIPGPNSMISFAAVAFTPNGDGSITVLDSYYANLERLEGAQPDKNTMKWWNHASRKQFYELTLQDMVSPAVAMREAANMMEQFESKPVLVTYPDGYDFLWLYWYFLKFNNDCPFGFTALGMKTLAWAKMRGKYHDVTKRTMPDKWKVNLPHTHHALDDAKEQAAIFGKMFADV